MVKMHSEIFVVGAVEQGEEQGASWFGLAPAQCSVQGWCRSVVRSKQENSKEYLFHRLLAWCFYIVRSAGVNGQIRTLLYLRILLVLAAKTSANGISTSKYYVLSVFYKFLILNHSRNLL